jgi:hypothetical protein
MRSKMTRLFLAPLLALLALVGGVSVPAWAGEDTGMCKADNSRVSIPGDLPIKACFDGKTLHLLNDTSIPVAVTLTGDGVGTPARSPQGDIGASQMLSFIRPGDFGSQPQINGSDFRSGVVPPGYYLRTPIGNSEVKVHVTEADNDTQRTYFLGEVVWRYLPLSGGAELAKTVSEFLSEIAKVGDEYIRCIDRNKTWGDVGCVLLVDRNILFAIGRAAFKGLAKDLPKAIVSAFETGKWRHSITGDRQTLKSGARDFTINAYTPPPAPKPVAPVQPPQPPPVNNGHQGGSGGNNGGNVIPPPDPKTATAVVQNMHLEGGSGLGEDSTPSYLSTVMQPSCASNGCKIGGTDMWSGDTFTALCWTTGSGMTNENRGRSDDDNNPNRIDTDHWLKGQKNGQTGYISFVYVTPGSRSLPIDHC